MGKALLNRPCALFWYTCITLCLWAGMLRGVRADPADASMAPPQPPENSTRAREQPGQYWHRLERALHVFAESGATSKWSDPAGEEEAWRRWQSPLHKSPVMELYHRSIANTGSPARLYAFLWKLRAGQPVIVDVKGGSVTANGVREHGETGRGYIRLFWDWLTTAFPHPGHVLLNDAESGATASELELCSVYSAVDSQGIDLILVEMAINLEGLADTAEKLIRASYEHPGGPAVLLLHWFNLPRGRGRGEEEQHLDYYSCNDETTLGPIGGYYGLPSISFKQALWPVMEANDTHCLRLWSELQSKYRQPDTAPAWAECAGFRHGANLLWMDGRHPTYAGNALMATFLIELLTEHLRRLPPAFSGPTHPITARVAPSPPPLFKGWYNHSRSSDGTTVVDPNLRKCYKDEELHQFAATATGWEWTVEHSRTGLPRPGWVSHTPGDVLEFNIGLWVERLHVAFLETYENIGQAKFECIGGMVCETVVDALAEARVSINKIVELDIDFNSDLEKRPRRGQFLGEYELRDQWAWTPDLGTNTTLRITNLGGSKIGAKRYVSPNPNDKFKISALIVSRPRYHTRFET